MDNDCEIVGEVKASSPLMKTLKQSRLPFSLLDSKTPQKIKNSPNQKKRRLSDSCIPMKFPKTPRNENRQVALSSVNSRKVPKSGKKLIKGKTTNEKEDNTKKNRKRGRITLKEKGSTHHGHNNKLDKLSCQMTSDEEVSSSVDDEVEVPRAKKKPLEKAQTLLSAFIGKEPTQQAEISTSTEDPLDEEDLETEEMMKSEAEMCVELKGKPGSTALYESEEIEINDRKEGQDKLNKNADHDSDGTKEDIFIVNNVNKATKDDNEDKSLEKVTGEIDSSKKKLVSRTDTKKLIRDRKKKIVLKPGKKDAIVGRGNKRKIQLKKVKTDGMHLDSFEKQLKKSEDDNLNDVRNEKEMKETENEDIGKSEVKEKQEERVEKEIPDDESKNLNEGEKFVPKLSKEKNEKTDRECKKLEVRKGEQNNEMENEKPERKQDQDEVKEEEQKIKKGGDVMESETDKYKMQKEVQHEDIVGKEGKQEETDVENVIKTKGEEEDVKKEEPKVNEVEKEEPKVELGKSADSMLKEGKHEDKQQEEDESKGEKDQIKLNAEQNRNKKESNESVGNVKQDREEAASLDTVVKIGKVGDTMESEEFRIREKKQMEDVDCEMEELEKESEKIEDMKEEVVKAVEEEVNTKLKIQEGVRKEGTDIDETSCEVDENKIGEVKENHMKKNEKTEAERRKSDNMEKKLSKIHKFENTKSGKVTRMPLKKDQTKKITSYLSMMKCPTKDPTGKSNSQGENKEKVEIKEDDLMNEEEEKANQKCMNESVDETNEKGNDSDMDSSENVDATGKVSDSSVDCDSGVLGPSAEHLISKPKLKIGKLKKLTPKQREREAERRLKTEERERKKQEREKKKQEEIAEKERIRKEKEEERQKQKEEKERMKDNAKRQKKEEQQRKDEEKKQKDEAKKQAEEEKQKQNAKLKNKFASFFVAKKRDVGEPDEESENGLFKQFRVKEDMRLAQVNRKHLSEEDKLTLDHFLYDNQRGSCKTFLEILKSEDYVAGKSEKTWPPEDKKEVDDDVEIIEDEEEDLENMDGMIEDVVARMTKGKHTRGKLLSFCENRRPAYWGTWSKNSSCVSARRPFAKDKVFDYEYDSDDDWEEEETGESLSDSEGEEKEEEGDGDQYEVDNDFFVPHGYLSEDEGRSDEEDPQDEVVSQDDESKNREKLKQKQAEFEEEMKQKTKQLKPRVRGCLWMADKNNRAYDQLLRILSPHKVVSLSSQLPIGTSHGGLLPQDTKDNKLDDDFASDDKNITRPKYLKKFPEEAVPSLIELLHGNRNGKLFLSREFPDYWRNGDIDCNEESRNSGLFIARRKVEAKIKELGRWRSCPDEGPFHKVMMWYVPKEVREKHGVGELSLPNTWNYINKPKERRDVNQDDIEASEEGSKISKSIKLTPITAFAKKLPLTTISSPTLPASSTKSMAQSSDADESCNNTLSTTPPQLVSANLTSASPLSLANIQTPSRKTSSAHPKKKIALTSELQEPVPTTTQSASFVSFFKKSGEKSSSKSDAKEEKSKDSQDAIECIVLD